MIDIQSRIDRLTKNCAEFPKLEALAQLSVIYQIIDDARYLRVKISDYLMPQVSHHRQSPKAESTESVICPYCGEAQKSIAGLRSHLGLKHKEKKSEWQGTTAPNP